MKIILYFEEILQCKRICLFLLSRRLITTTTTSRGKLSILTLRPSQRGDTGFYVCTAKNKFGNAILAMRLVVLGDYFNYFKGMIGNLVWLVFECLESNLYIYFFILLFVEAPEPPENLTLVKKTSRTIKVKWSSPYDGNSPILFYSVQYKVQKGQWYVLTFIYINLISGATINDQNPFHR